ncbi:MAG TPA: nickel pincer cofactor biosynthesis protein LarB [Candidatus Binataceae bacterium]|nr:nickel pincer cofactor biosynthesis protein LarB [Candidatus Binataceae bacterium]
MTEAKIRQLLRQVAERRVSPDQALEKLRDLPFEDLGFAQIDHHRTLRRGLPEVIFGEGKTAAQIIAIGKRIVANETNLVITRLDAVKAQEVKRKLHELDYHEEARIGTILTETPRVVSHGMIGVLCAGTSDIPIAEEAALCAELFGNSVERLYDVGVAGLHRLVANLALIRRATVLIVAAGMEGALPSVVAGMVSAPVIAVPTSIGYGASFKGITALLGMLNSCASGVTVVNIDNGFGAAFAATLINRAGLGRGNADG